jgi:hypothetical protein
VGEGRDGQVLCHSQLPEQAAGKFEDVGEILIIAMDQKVNYTPNTINAVASAIHGDDGALAWLEKFKFKEWVLFVKYLADDDDSAYEELANGEHKEFAAFADAIQRDGDALNFLLANKFTILAAVANSALHDEEAYQWLIANELPHYAALADALRQFLRPPSTHTGRLP